MAILNTRPEETTVEDTHITHLSKSGLGSFKVTFLNVYNYVLGKLNSVLATKTDKLITTNRQTSSYTLVIGDATKLVEMNVASANNLTVPPNSSVAFSVGTQLLISQYGAGQTSIVAGSGVTIRSADSALKLRSRYSMATLVKIATDEWYLSGDITV